MEVIRSNEMRKTIIVLYKRVSGASQRNMSSYVHWKLDLVVIITLLVVYFNKKLPVFILQFSQFQFVNSNSKILVSQKKQKNKFYLITCTCSKNPRGQQKFFGVCWQNPRSMINPIIFYESFSVVPKSGVQL